MRKTENKRVLISIRPEWAIKIFNGVKTMEIRKSAPNIKPPFKCYVYCTKGNPKDPWQRCETHNHKSGKIHLCNGFVMGEIIITGILEGYTGETIKQMEESSLVEASELYAYSKGGKLYGWKIEKVKLYDKPKPLRKLGLQKAPQSWRYITENE